MSHYNRNNTLLLSLAFCFFLINIKAQNSLLWKISGNGIKSPSFLYGTMHLKDKRLFNFYDSLPGAIYKCDLFALEVDPDSLNKLTMKALSEDRKKTDEDNIPQNYKDEIRKKLEEELGISPKNLRAKDLRKIKRYLQSGKEKKDDMPTFLDGYLFNMARRMGKIITGLETIQEHEGALDGISKEKTEQKAKEFLNKEFASDRETSLERLIKYYVEADFENIIKYYDEYSEEFIDEVLIRRNIKMAERIDSIIKTGTLFSAVGVAHLPGEQGMINLLRKKGYTVEPVAETRSGYYKKLKFPVVEPQWTELSVQETGMTCKLPGAASPYKTGNVLLDMLIHNDIGTGSSYFITTTTMNELKNNNDIEQRFHTIEEIYKNNPKYEKFSMERKKISGMEGVELKFKSSSGSYNFVAQVMLGKREFFMLMVGYKNNNEHPEDIAKFFSSFQKTERKTAGWEKFSSKDGAFELMLPGKVKTNETKTKSEGEIYRIQSFSGADASGNQHLVRYYNMPPGYFVSNDKATFAQFVDITRERVKIAYVTDIVKDTVFDGYPAQYIHFAFVDGTALKALQIIRDSRIYTVMSVLLNADTSVSSDFVINSFRFLPPKKTSINSFSVIDSLVTCLLPEQPVTTDENADTSAEAAFYTFKSFDKNTGTTFFIQNGHLGKYYYAKSDSIHFYSIRKDNVNYDSIISDIRTKEDGCYISDMTLYDTSTYNLKRIKTICKNKEIWYLTVNLSPQAIHSPFVDSIFSSFRFTKKTEEFNPFAKKSDLIINDLHSSDSTALNEALEAVYAENFDISDTALLRKTMLHAFGDDSTYEGTRGKIIAVWASVDDSGLMKFVEHNYNFIRKQNSNVAASLAEALSWNKTETSYKLLKKILKENPNSDSYNSYMFNALADSLKLSVMLYPDILKACATDTFCFGVQRLTSMLLDSGLITQDMIKPWMNIFVEAYKYMMNELKKDNDDYLSPFLTHLVSLTGEEEFKKLSSPALNSKNLYPLLIVTQTRLNRGYVVKREEVKKLIKWPGTRADVFLLLREKNKLDLLDKEMTTQAFIAEGELYNYCEYRDVIASEIKLIKEIIRDSAGTAQKFLVFKVNFKEKDIQTAFGFAGPYPVKTGADVKVSPNYLGLGSADPKKIKEEQALEIFLTEYESINYYTTD